MKTNKVNKEQAEKFVGNGEFMFKVVKPKKDLKPKSNEKITKFEP